MRNFLSSLGFRVTGTPLYILLRPGPTLDVTSAQHLSLSYVFFFPFLSHPARKYFSANSEVSICTSHSPFPDSFKFCFFFVSYVPSIPMSWSTFCTAAQSLHYVKTLTYDRNRLKQMLTKNTHRNGSVTQHEWVYRFNMMCAYILSAFFASY